MDLSSLIQKNNTKIVFIILDGVGGLPIDGKTELERANKPNLDSLARVSACGLHIPVDYGITPGSGPGHFGVFGYDPLKYEIGRGVLEALGVDIELQKTDVAIRCNYATKKDGLIVDRRAGRISTEKNIELTKRLSENIDEIDGVKIILKPGKEHRFCLVMRFKKEITEKHAMVKDTDPQKEGKPPFEPTPLNEESLEVSEIAKKFIRKAEEILKNEEKANYVLLRGFSALPDIPSFEQKYGLKACSIAVYPMYRGITKLLGMDTIPVQGDIKEEVEILKKVYKDYDFIFLHVKKIDSFGEDGNFEGKVKKIEEFDSFLPEILSLNPDALVITGDHSTPCLLKTHSWHPVPLLIKSPYVLGGTVNSFTERECLKGEIGIIRSVSIMPLVLANTLRLRKFGA
ncbi:MAG: 2,3-bisphosphoglycerate-independent phosphoglycerate mutase [Thermodesulfovibrio sp.]|nr:2,3-bisphosphoglycerate-independent phosphoglycerate mutase [Thermodesulfovibrio sp.]MCX7724640.1 2,3-bisphosphoglycerate-independent phosphoglycerate mutase [Thermodesulfovibrio sp.]MDW7972672.1 2,3-bisphosphoglycerate-independent phosphoglycerate mutase [Thermodesulfovibrio sp.]